ncbi:ABC transporter substrate-binding protein [Paenibacillus humicola]|uniref:ABC transporter substrate-binding protein n=1 Tax=Paenibacillus humicola TaxID=3110540 RepID=UPI00237A59B2|nr:ABC transporter substrate-binding protein [Paenibacillus humicola]
MKLKMALPFLLVFILGLTACSDGGAGGSNGSGGSGGSSSKKVTLTWWSQDSPSFVDANKQLIEAYKKVHPEITINYQTFPYDAFIQKLQASYASGNPPDIAQMFGTWVWEYAKNGKLEPLDLGTLKDDLYPAAIGGYTYNNQVYGIPHEFNIENDGMLAWKDMFDKKGIAYPPKTWNDMIEAAQKLTVYDGNKIKVRGLDITSNDSVNFTFLAMILQQGGKYWTEDNHVNFQTPEAVKAMTALTDLITKYKVSDLSTFGNTDEEPYMIFFKNGSAMTTAGPWTIAEGKTTFGTDGFDYIPVPSFTSGPPVFAAESGWGEVVSAASKNKEAAKDFVTFAAQPDQAKAWNLRTFTVPANKKVAADADFLQQVPLMKTSLDVLQYGQWVGPVIDRDYWWKVVSDHFQAICEGKVTVEEGLKQIQDNINQMIDSHK